MILLEEDAQYFLHLYKDLLLFVVDSSPNLKNKEYEGIHDVLSAARDLMITDLSVIDNYIDAKNLDDEAKRILQDIRDFHIFDDFIVVKELKKNAIFLTVDQKEKPVIFAVKAFTTKFSEMSYYPLPLRIKTLIIPFKEFILCDGLILHNEIIIGPNMRRGFNEDYMEAKLKGKILDDSTKLKKYLKKNNER